MAALMDSRFELRLSKTERETLAESAQTHGLTESAYLRWMIRTHATGAVIKSGNVGSK